MNTTEFPIGWNEERVHSVCAHYEQQTEDEAVAEDEAVFVELLRKHQQFLTMLDTFKREEETIPLEQVERELR